MSIRWDALFSCYKSARNRSLTQLLNFFCFWLRIRGNFRNRKSTTLVPAITDWIRAIWTNLDLACQSKNLS
jgi:hypothetical protein